MSEDVADAVNVVATATAPDAMARPPTEGSKASFVRRVASGLPNAIPCIYDFIKSQISSREGQVSEQPKIDTPRMRSVVTVQHATLLWVREQIATGAFRSGDQLRQEILARAFGVSVPPVREALKTLEAEGQVVYAPHRGYFVASMNYAELAENYRIRELLETEAIQRSVPVIGRQEIARMREAIHDMERSHRTDDLPGLTAANRRFHFTLFDTAGMPRMADIIRILWDQSDRYRSVYFSTQSHRRRVNSEHRAIMTAVREQKTDLAVELLRDHREHALRSLQPTLLAAQTSSLTAEP